MRLSCEDDPNVTATSRTLMLTQGELDALWDFDDPGASESRLRSAANVRQDQRERDELLTQVARAMGLRGRFLDANVLLDRVSREDGYVDVRAALERGRLLNATGDPSAALPLFLHAAENADRLQLPYLEVDALHMAAIVDPADAEAWTAHALRVLAEQQDPRVLRWRVALFHNLGWARFDRADFDGAVEAFAQAKGAADRWGTADERAFAAQAIDECAALIASAGRDYPVADSALRPDPYAASHVDVLIPRSRFTMGDASGDGTEADGELPLHEVDLSAYRIDVAPVTNAQFARFVKETGYRTDAERYGWSAVFAPQVRAALDAVAGPMPSEPWWCVVAGSDWAHPLGPQSTWQDVADHPVVHVSHSDALAYCVWSGRRLPTEAEWENAARGGLAGARYPWGDQLVGPDGTHHANLFQGTFPELDTADDGYAGTSPVGSFPPNGFGLYDVSGNVFEWCADWFSPDAYTFSARKDPAGPERSDMRVIRGGSYLSHASYCTRYRVAGRHGNTPDSSAGNCGFRTVVSA